MIEKIGKAVLDDTCYPGQDLYSDGAIEDEMLKLPELIQRSNGTR